MVKRKTTVPRGVVTIVIAIEWIHKRKTIHMWCLKSFACGPLSRQVVDKRNKSFESWGSKEQAKKKDD
jgi:hypothetical protein